MNKTELVNSVAEAADLSKKDASKAVDAVFDTIQDALAKGEKIQLLVLVTLRFVNVLLVRVVTHKQVRKSKSLQAKYLLSNQVKRLRTR